MERCPGPCRTSERGVTLVEVLVATMLFGLLVIGFLGALDASTRVARVQGDISDMTENIRFTLASLVRVTRMAGCGGLPLVSQGASGLQPVAVEVRDNSTGGGDFTFGSRTALSGTDVLIVRGVMNGQLWDVAGADVSYSGGTGQVTVRAVSPYTADPQPLTTPSYVVGMPILLSLQLPCEVAPAVGGVRRYSEFRLGVVTATSTPGSGALVVQFRGTGSEELLTLNRTGYFQPFANNLVAAAGLLDDLIFFVARNDQGEPALFRATGSAGGVEELISGVSNLQVALGCDVDRNGVLAEGEWFGSATNPASATGDQLAAVRELRLTVVVQSQAADLRWSQAPPRPENSPAIARGSDHRQRAVTVRITLRSHPPLEDA